MSSTETILEGAAAASAFDPGRTVRPRRLRRSESLRHLVRETRLSPADFVHPFFVMSGHGVERPIEGLPGHAQWSVDRMAGEIDAIRSLGISAVLLFGVPETKDATGREAWNSAGPVPAAIRFLKQYAPELVVIADVCLCAYTDHGHCGVLDTKSNAVHNDATLLLLARAAIAYADAGADIVAPSAMMDGQVGAIRTALDARSHQNVAILAYAAKFASALYGPFRTAAGSSPAVGDRRGYQMDFGNAREAIREILIDAKEGADMVMVKPAGLYLDVIAAARRRVSVPIAAYQVSGEYAMLKAAADRGWIDERRAVLESLTAITRAGADVIITYYAREAAKWLIEERR